MARCLTQNMFGMGMHKIHFGIILADGDDKGHLHSGQSFYNVVFKVTTKRCFAEKKTTTLSGF